MQFGPDEKESDIAMSMAKPVFKELAKPKEAKKRDIVLENPWIREAFSSLVTIPLLKKDYELINLSKEAAKSIVDNLMYPTNLIENSINKELNKTGYR